MTELEKVLLELCNYYNEPVMTGKIPNPRVSYLKRWFEQKKSLTDTDLQNTLRVIFEQYPGPRFPSIAHVKICYDNRNTMIPQPLFFGGWK